MLNYITLRLLVITVTSEVHEGFSKWGNFKLHYIASIGYYGHMKYMWVFPNLS